MPNHPKRRSKLDQLLDQIKRLAPNQIAEAERALKEARQHAEARVEIDGAAVDRACPWCGGDDRRKWGRTERGEQRWRCKDCKRTWSGLTGTPAAGVHRPDLLLEAVRDMFGDAPLSCRKLARKLGISRDTVWRWRMRVLSALPSAPVEVFQGIVEADETFQRESRKGSREWVRHHRAPNLHPQPPRQRWRDYGRQGPPQAIVRRFLKPVLGVADRSGRANLTYIPDTRQPTIAAALLPQVAPDALLLSDGAPQYQAIATAAGLGYWMLVGGRRSFRTPATYHLNTINSLHARWKEFLKPFRGPATRNLDGYARWLIARREGYLPAFRRLLA